MSDKKILVSTGDSKYKEISVSISGSNDNILSASNITINTASLQQNSNGLLQVVGGNIEVLSASINNYKISYNGNKFETNTADTADLGGDLYGTQYTPKIRNLSNVKTGILSIANGGTGTGSFGVGNLVTSNGDGPTYTGNADKLLTVNSDGNYVFVEKNNLTNSTPMTGALVYLFTGSAGIKGVWNVSPYYGFTGNPYITSWTKPAGCRFIRVICQGGGAGGRGAGSWSAQFAGSGGSGGGFADVVFDALSIPNTPITVYAGGGGGGAAGRNSNGAWPGGVGGDSYFGEYVYCQGGQNTTTPDYGTQPGGFGYNISGGNGGIGRKDSTAGSNGASVVSAVYGAAAGGGGGGNNSTTAARVGYNGGSITISPLGITLNGGAGGAAGLNGSPGVTAKNFNFESYFLNGVLQNGNFPSLLCSGGGGGGAINSQVIPGDGGDVTFGSGGGGGACRSTVSTTATRNGIGGNGGVGYVLIICY